MLVQKNAIVAVAGVAGIVLAVVLFGIGSEDTTTVAPVPENTTKTVSTPQSSPKADDNAQAAGEIRRSDDDIAAIRLGGDDDKVLQGRQFRRPSVVEDDASKTPAVRYASRLSGPWTMIRRQLSEAGEDDLADEVEALIKQLRDKRRTPDSVEFEDVLQQQDKVLAELDEVSDSIPSIAPHLERVDRLLEEYEQETKN